MIGQIGAAAALQLAGGLLQRGTREVTDLRQFGIERRRFFQPRGHRLTLARVQRDVEAAVGPEPDEFRVAAPAAGMAGA